MPAPIPGHVHKWGICRRVNYVVGLTTRVRLGRRCECGRDESVDVKLEDLNTYPPPTWAYADLGWR